MFLFWEGFEIDGSDTDFDVVLPETQELIAFVDCFLALPLFGAAIPHFHYSSGPPKFKRISLSKQKLIELLLRGDRPQIHIEINCRVMDELPEAIHADLYRLSEERQPHEAAYGRVERPCMAPVRQEYQTRGELTVSLGIMPPGTKKKWHTAKDTVLEGYVRNEALMLSKEELPCITVNVGPGFYYEYAIYMMKWLEDHFPGISIAGGLDCGGGWTDGCTYANSIYRYEKIQLPVKYNIRNTLKRLTEYDLLRSYCRYHRKKGLIYETCSTFRMVNIPKEKWGESYLLSYADYAEQAEKTLEEQTDYFSSICKTAVHTLLPKPSRFESLPKIKQQLEQSLDGLIPEKQEWIFEAYAAFAKVDGQSVCEYRVPWQLRKYFFTLLELMDSGKIDLVKTETYEKRMQENAKG